MLRNVLAGIVAVLLTAIIGPLACRSSAPSASRVQIAQSAVMCVDCHKEHVRQWENGAHTVVSCDPCHGLSAAHAASARAAQTKPTSRPVDGSQLCLGCHDRLKSFDAHVAAVEAKHVTKTDAERANGRCVYCHDPHSLQ